MGSPIQQFYNKKSVFLTGATGFLGKIIIDKLLRTCDIESFYILIRNKKGKGIHSRIEEIFDDPVSFFSFLHIFHIFFFEIKFDPIFFPLAI